MNPYEDAHFWADKTWRDHMELNAPPPELDNAQILFLWHERVKDGSIRVWIDKHDVLHFSTCGHPGCTLTVPL